jgi:hypothetical protein
MDIIASVPVLNICLLSWFAVGYAHCYTWVYFNFENKFQMPWVIATLQWV